MKIAIGADHRGFLFKEMLKKNKSIARYDIEWVDFGAGDNQRSDYPLFVTPVCKALQAGQAQKGILICGSGVGMSIAANRFAGIYAALVWNEDVARVSCEDDNANILVLPSDFISADNVVPIVAAWLSATFKNGHYQKRLTMIDQLGGI